MATALKNAFYRHGMRSGYAEYRYGRQKTVTLPPILTGRRREHVVHAVIDLLKDWNLSPFEHEGDALHGIRAGLCLNGHAWERADADARSVVSEGLRTVGAKRPLWAEGQHHYADSPDFCSWCKGPMDVEDRTRGQRFCSPECAATAIDRRDRNVDRRGDSVERAAYRLIARSRAEPRECLRCGKLFQRDTREAKFCSSRCSGSRGSSIPEQACEHCGKSFRPDKKTRASRFCSRECFNQAQRVLPDRSCPCCGTVFRPTAAVQIYCSQPCYLHRERALLPRQCVCCGEAFLAKLPKAIYCSPVCARTVFKFQSGQPPKKLSPPVFDYVMRVAA